MTQLARTLLANQVIPVILSPFIFGGGRSDRLARDCAGRLQQALAALPQAVYVDAYSEMDQHPRRRMLLADGSHLSLAGQRVVGEVLYPALKNLVDNQSWSLKKTPPPAAL
jgi:lysophospholipase L1-like esterase